MTPTDEQLSPNNQSVLDIEVPRSTDQQLAAMVRTLVGQLQTGKIKVVDLSHFTEDGAQIRVMLTSS